jgi:hypothetical protein
MSREPAGRCASRAARSGTLPTAACSGPACQGTRFAVARRGRRTAPTRAIGRVGPIAPGFGRQSVAIAARTMCHGSAADGDRVVRHDRAIDRLVDLDVFARGVRWLTCSARCFAAVDGAGGPWGAPRSRHAAQP